MLNNGYVLITRIVSVHFMINMFIQCLKSVLNNVKDVYYRMYQNYYNVQNMQNLSQSQTPKHDMVIEIVILVEIKTH